LIPDNLGDSFREYSQSVSAWRLRRASCALKIDAPASINELFRDGLVPVMGREVERRGPMRLLVILRQAAAPA